MLERKSRGQFDVKRTSPQRQEKSEARMKKVNCKAYSLTGECEEDYG